MKIFVDLGPWLSSIKNQLWWSFHNSIGNLEMLKEKLNSVTEHLCNIHHFPGNKHYEKCEHGNLEKAWLNPESLVMIGYSEYLAYWYLQAITKVKNAIHGYQNVRFNDLEYMTEFTHTGDLGKIIKFNDQ